MFTNKPILPMLVLMIAGLFVITNSSTGVMEITLNNLKNVLATYQEVHVLFHNPQCLHSRKYVEQFLRIDLNNNNNNNEQEKSQLPKLGIVDCIRELQLCQQYNLTVFPVLLKYSLKNNVENGENNVFELIDEQEFLVSYNVKTEQDDEVIANKFVSYLTREPHYAIVIFEDYALPVEHKERISQQEHSHIFYLQPYHKEENPSEFTRLISSFVNNRNGCWIFRRSEENNELLKYACDSGYSKNITLKYIKLFTEGKLKKYVFQQEPRGSEQQFNEGNSQESNIIVTNINNEQLIRTLSHELNTNQANPCGLVYVSSKHCVSCKEKDIKAILMAIESLKINIPKNKLEVFRFDVDRNEIPSSLVGIGLKRVPEIIYVCDNKVKVFGKVLFVETIIEFIEESQLLSSSSPASQTTTTTNQSNKSENKGTIDNDEQEKEF